MDEVISGKRCDILSLLSPSSLPPSLLHIQVGIKHVAQVHLEQLERVLRGEHLLMPFEAIQALDVVMRHLPSMR